MAALKTPLRVLAALCALAGLVSLAVGAMRFSSESRFLAGASRTLGKVVEIQTTPVDDESNRYCPIVQFATPDGRPQSFVDAVCGPTLPHRKGDIVPVLYDPAAPAHARIDQDTTALAALAQPALWALLAWLAAAALLFARRPRPGSPASPMSPGPPAP
ncbi:MAG: DUF3592 domain-containing protein [Myxococcales bacterium]